MKLAAIPALKDNYIWVLYNDKGQCIIVDPGIAEPVIKKIAKQQWQPQAILLTHHHQDHIGGVNQLRQHFPDILIYGPQEIQSVQISHIIGDGDNFTICNHNFNVIATPGHTLGHIVYYSSPWLFSGDTLFSAGCGRLFEGTAQQMYHSLQRINQLPANTLICCGHEYILDNLKFAASIMTNDNRILSCLEETHRLINKKNIFLPTKLAHERKINLFLRTYDIDLIKALGFNLVPQSAWEVFAELRRKKDHF